jgi:guanine deaminase
MQKEFMYAAVEEALNGMEKNDGGPFGAIIVHENRIISKAHNMVLSTNDPTAHAEILAIRKAGTHLSAYDLSDCILYTNCEPCPMCLAAILWARIPKVYYTCTRKDAEKIGFDDNVFYEFFENNNPGILTVKQLQNESAYLPFKKWQKKEDRIIY